MKKYHYILAAGTAICLPTLVWAATCSTLPDCDSLGFTFSEADCGKLSKLKCPFGNKYFCSTNNCKSVSVNPYSEKCTKYCEDDKNICIEKRDATCSELMYAQNCTRYNHNATISGTITKDICIFGTVKQSTGYGNSLNFSQVHIYDAGKRFPACESEMTGRAKLDLGSISITNYAYFHTDVDIDYISYRPNGQQWSANFYGNTRIKVEYQPQTSWSGQLSLFFYGEDKHNKTTNQVAFICNSSSGDTWNKPTANLRIEHHNADVTYCSEMTSYGNCTNNYGNSVECQCSINIECDQDGYTNSTCSESSGYYSCGYWYD